MRSCTPTDLRQLRAARLAGEFTCLPPGGLLIVAQSQDSHWLAADRPPNYIGEICSFYHAFTWVLDSFVPSIPGRRKNIITDREYCVHLFADGAI